MMVVICKHFVTCTVAGICPQLASLCFEDLKNLNLVHPWTDDGCPVKGCCYKCPGGDSQRRVLRRTAREEGSGGRTEEKLFKRSL